MARFTTESVAGYANAVMGLVNLAVYIAAPRITAAHGPMPDREHILAHIDDYIKRVEDFGPSTDERRNVLDTLPAARRLRELCEAWIPSVHVPDDIRSATREFLASYGIDEPVGGWDTFDGFPDEQGNTP